MDNAGKKRDSRGQREWVGKKDLCSSGLLFEKKFNLF